jgi:parallel beta-helix repeat protein
MRFKATGLLLAAALASGPALAVQRTFVSTAGNDANVSNNCSLVAPCRTFDIALTVTDTGGEIIVLASGAYGRTTVNKSVTIQSPSGTYAGISVFPGTNGIDVNGTGITVSLRGLFLNGQGGTAGISFAAGNALFVENCVIANMNGPGIAVTASGADVIISDTTIRSNGQDGVSLASSVSATLTRVQSVRNVNSGISVSTGAQATIRNSVASENGQHGIYAVASSGGTKVSIDETAASGNVQAGLRLEASLAATRVDAFAIRSVFDRNIQYGSYATAPAGIVSATATDSLISANGIGVRVDQSGATFTVSGNTVVNNAGYGLSLVNGAVINTRQNNTVRDNNGVSPQIEGVPTIITPS